MTRSGVVITYGYDGWGNLIQETVNGVTTEFVLDENTAYTRILGEIRSDGGERLYAYGPEGFSAQQAVGSTVEYALLDGLGSVRHLTDAGGTVILTRSYDAYGWKHNTECHATPTRNCTLDSHAAAGTTPVHHLRELAGSSSLTIDRSEGADFAYLQKQTILISHRGSAIVENATVFFNDEWRAIIEGLVTQPNLKLPDG